jgi:hypothetical protein
MIIAVTIGTVSWRSAPSLAANEVAYNQGPETITPTMIWDAGINNMRPRTQAEIDNIPTEQLAAFRTNTVNNAQVTQQQDAMFVRALTLTALDEFNLHANVLNQMMAAVAAATTLADLKTRFAAITPQPYPTRTKAQMYNTTVGHIQDGTADGSQ